MTPEPVVWSTSGPDLLVVLKDISLTSIVQEEELLIALFDHRHEFNVLSNVHSKFLSIRGNKDDCYTRGIT